MAAELGLRVLFADLDPQANLTAAFLSEDRLENPDPTLTLPTGSMRAADGAFGGHQQAAQRAFSDFRQLTRQVLGATGVLVG